MNAGKLTAAQLERIQKALDDLPFAKLIGIELDQINEGVATLGLEVRNDLMQNNGVVHGGAIASLIDTAAAFAIVSVLPSGERVTTVDLTISYLRPLTTGRARATARVVRAGRRLITVSGEVLDDGGKPVAIALTTYIKI
jgi:uncharacterized protein (TIGR00369 family)